jgi:hypothetical protein
MKSGVVSLESKQDNSRWRIQGVMWIRMHERVG